MLKIDETHITALERDELGTWTAEAYYGDTTLRYSWDPSTQEERDDDRKFAVLSTLDNLRVVAVRGLIGDGQEYRLDDADLLETLVAAERVGDHEVASIVVEAWSRGLLCVKPSVTDRLITFEEVMASRRADAVDDVATATLAAYRKPTSGRS